MQLYEIAIGSYLFSKVVDFDESFLALQEAAEGSVDLDRDDHRQALLVWLNKWGCRQFAREYHQHASDEIAAWYAEDARLLPAMDMNLGDLPEKQMGRVADAYHRLSIRTASFRNGNVPVAIGPTGSAKVMFAVRPRALPPWDGNIRKGLGLDGSRASYIDYLEHVKVCLSELAVECNENGFELADFPARLGRPEVTLPKLVDEYYWLTITRKIILPSPETVRQWLTLT